MFSDTRYAKRVTVEQCPQTEITPIRSLRYDEFLESNDRGKQHDDIDVGRKLESHMWGRVWLKGRVWACDDFLAWRPFGPVGPFWACRTLRPFGLEQDSLGFEGHPVLGGPSNPGPWGVVWGLLATQFLPTATSTNQIAYHSINATTNTNTTTTIPYTTASTCLPCCTSFRRRSAWATSPTAARARAAAPSRSAAASSATAKAGPQPSRGSCALRGVRREARQRSALRKAPRCQGAHGGVCSVGARMPRMVLGSAP